MMRAVTLWQPWASLVAIGAKQWETRSWAADFRGLFAIHAALTKDYFEVGRQPAFMKALGRAGLTPYDLPYGKVVAIARLVDCIPSEQARPGELEREFGDYAPNRWVWQLADVAPIVPAVHARGGRKIWTWDEDGAGVPVAAPGLFV